MEKFDALKMLHVMLSKTAIILSSANICIYKDEYRWYFSAAPSKTEFCYFPVWYNVNIYR